MLEKFSPNQNADAALFGQIAHLSISPRKYYALVQSFNRMMQHRIVDQLGDTLPESVRKTVTLITPGSDGRREKGSVESPLEIIALIDGDMSSEKFTKSLLETIRSLCPSGMTQCEIKTPQSKLSFYKDDSKRVQPTRVADGSFLFGERKNLDDAKQRLGEEIISLPGKTIVKRVVSLVRDARNATESGKNKIAGDDAIHFDLENQIIFYNPKAKRLSFKIGPLRLVQNTLLLQTIKHIRSEHQPSFIKTLATGILPRLHQLSDDRMVNRTKESVREIMEHYAFFLRLYHRSEQAYNYNKTTAIEINKNVAEEIARRLKALSELMRDFEIKRQTT